MSRSNIEDARIEGADIIEVRREVYLVPDAATLALSASLSGRLLVFPNLTADCTITMPAEVKGLEYWFQYGGAAADAQDWIFDTGAEVNFFVGGVTHSDLDGDTQAPVYSNGSSHSKFTVLVPEVGTLVHMVCDGLKWYINGNVSSATVCTFAAQ